MSVGSQSRLPWATGLPKALQRVPPRNPSYLDAIGRGDFASVWAYWACSRAERLLRRLLTEAECRRLWADFGADYDEDRS